MRRTYLALAATMAIGLSVASCTTTQEQKVANTLTDLQIAANAYAAACAATASTKGPCKPSVANTVGTAGAVAGAAKGALQ
jgi:hypothetical protein